MQQELCEEYVKQFPLTMRIERLLRQFESGHHAVSVVEGITSDLIGCGESTKLTFLTQDQFKRTEKGLIVLIYSMICQFFPEIALIENATRMKFLQRFYDQFVPIYRAEMTVRKFSDPELSYAIVLPGGCVDLNNLEEVIDIKNLEHRRQISSAFCIRISDFMNKKYRPLNISRLEFASIVGLLFWNCVERILSDFIEEKIILSNRDQLYAELHAIIVKNKLNCSNNSTTNNFPFSPIFNESSIRFGRLLDLLSHLTIFSWESAEVFQMAKIFMDLPDLWDEINLPNNTK